MAEERPDADTVRCQASISGHCLSLSEGFGYCEEGECDYGAFHGTMPDDGQGAALTDERADVPSK